MKIVVQTIAYLVVIELTINSVFGLTTKREFLPDSVCNRIYVSDIHTVLLHSASWELGLPVIEVGSDQKLELRFDDLSAEVRSFGYTLVHCDAAWHSTILSPAEYLSGYGQGVIREKTASFNTTRDYTHFRLIFPEEDCMPLLSGNYALVVYDEADPEKVVFTCRFYVTEKTVQVTGRIRQPSQGEYNRTHQQIDFTLRYADNLIRDPMNDIVVMITRNSRYNFPVRIGKPTLFKPGLLEYTDHPDALFQGGNEFRSLDIKSMKYQSENIASIDFRNPYYHVLLKTDEERENKPYFSRTDLDGGYYIDREKADDKHTEADYVYVHFNFKPPVLYAHEDTWITGEFLDWSLLDENKMIYDPAKDRYEATLLLKQGLYDYCYALRDSRTGEPETGIFEGNHTETTNEYIIAVYYHDQYNRYDRLLAFYPVK